MISIEAESTECALCGIKGIKKIPDFSKDYVFAYSFVIDARIIINTTEENTWRSMQEID